MLTAPPWAGAASPPWFPPLSADARTGVCVVGAGLAGLTTSLLLAKRGFAVTLLEQGAVGSGESGRSTGHLTTALDAGYLELERRLGQAGARLAAESQSAAMELLAGLCAEHEIACGFELVDGFHVGRVGGDDALEAEAQAARRAGLIEVERLPRVPGDLFGSRPCLRFPRQAQVDPSRLLAGLARALTSAGARIHSDTRAVAVEGGSPVRIRCGSGLTVAADAAILAAHDVPGRARASGRPAAWRTYALAAPIQPRALPRAVYWDSERPYHYARSFAQIRGSWPREMRNYVVVGGEDHPTGSTRSAEDRFARLEGWLRRHFPMARSVTHRWSGQILETPDGLPAIGLDPRRRNVAFATGFSGTGLTHAVAAAMVLSDALHGRRNPWAGLFDPARLPLRPADLAREGLRWAGALSAWLAPGEARTARGLEPGRGAVVRRGLSAVALFRDQAGNLHCFSAACQHRGCSVRWNDAERSWDCPCHGSRYDGLGRVVNGPAVEGLKRLRPVARDGA